METEILSDDELAEITGYKARAYSADGLTTGIGTTSKAEASAR